MQYQVTPAHGPYGARIWLRNDTNISERVMARLKLLSKWGGPDKNDRDLVAWEFGDDKFREAVAYLEGYGYTQAPEGNDPD